MFRQKPRKPTQNTKDFTNAKHQGFLPLSNPGKTIEKLWNIAEDTWNTRKFPWWERPRKIKTPRKGRSGENIYLTRKRQRRDIFVVLQRTQKWPTSGFLSTQNHFWVTLGVKSSLFGYFWVSLRKEQQVSLFCLFRVRQMSSSLRKWAISSADFQNAAFGQTVISLGWQPPFSSFCRFPGSEEQNPLFLWRIEPPPSAPASEPSSPLSSFSPTPNERNILSSTKIYRRRWNGHNFFVHKIVAVINNTKTCWKEGSETLAGVPSFTQNALDRFIFVHFEPCVLLAEGYVFTHVFMDSNSRNWHWNLPMSAAICIRSPESPCQYSILVTWTGCFAMVVIFLSLARKF